MPKNPVRLLPSMFGWANSILFSSVLFTLAIPTQAQDCNNAAATPHVCAFDPVKHAKAGTKLKGVLLMDWRNGLDDRGPTQRSMMRLAQKYGFRLDRTESQNYINDSTLRDIDIVVFNNGASDPIPGATQLNAIRDFVEKRGKAVLAIHEAAAYIPCPSENLESPDCRWFMRGLRTQFWNKNGDPTPATIYADSVKVGEIPPRATQTSAVPAMHNHGRMNAETRMIFENLPLNGGSGPYAQYPYIWEGLGDEWFTYRNNPRLEGARVINGVPYGPINILLSLDESSVASNAVCNGGSNACKNQGTFGDRPVSWTRKVGNGLFAYNNAGHSDVYVRARTVSLNGDSIRAIRDSLNRIISSYQLQILSSKALITELDSNQSQIMAQISLAISQLNDSTLSTVVKDSLVAQKTAWYSQVDSLIAKESKLRETLAEAESSLFQITSRTVSNPSPTITVRDSLMEKYNWRLMKYLARDFVGCMDSLSTYFNPEASVERLTESDLSTPCQIPESILQPHPKLSTLRQPMASAFTHFGGHGLTVHLNPQFKYDILVTNAAGILQAIRTVSNQSETHILALESGSYFVQWVSSEFRGVERVTLP